MLSDFWSLCGAMSPLGKVVLFSDVSIAIAYLAIPAALLVVWRRRAEDLPYPWMFALFSAFIVTCGVTHLVHAIQMPWTTFEHTALEAAAQLLCAGLSIVTAIALITVMPAALRMISPKQQRLILEAEVNRRTSENVELIREINHRLGNQLQILSSALRQEMRAAPENSDHEDALGKLEDVMNGLIDDYRQNAHRYGHSESVTVIAHAKGFNSRQVSR